MILSVVFLVTAFTCQRVGAQSAEDTLAVRNTVLDYLEGWYTGDAERMSKALYTGLVKRRITTLPQTGGSYVEQVGYSDMVEFTKAGFGKGKDPDYSGDKIIISGIFGNMATVKAVSPDFIDFIHLGKVSGEWRIVNVIWEPTQKAR